MAEQLRSTGVMNCLSNCKKTNQVLLLNDTVYLPGVKKDLISAQKKQLEADVFWLALKTINMSGYVMLNTLS